MDNYLEMYQITKKEFSRQTGIPYTTLMNLYSRGTANVQYSTVKKIADFMNLTVDELVEHKVAYKIVMELLN